MEEAPKIDKQPEWVKPNLESERGEIERATQEFLHLEPTEENVQRVINVLERGEVIELSDEEWSKLGNTDSFHNIKPGHIEDVKEVTKKYNQDLPDGNKRDFDTLHNVMSNEGKMEMPAILKLLSGESHLVSGNTRLMIARALKLRPTVLIGTLEKQ